MRFLEGSITQIFDLVDIVGDCFTRTKSPSLKLGRVPWELLLRLRARFAASFVPTELRSFSTRSLTALMFRAFSRSAAAGVTDFPVDRRMNVLIGPEGCGAAHERIDRPRGFLAHEYGDGCLISALRGWGVIQRALNQGEQVRPLGKFES